MPCTPNSNTLNPVIISPPSLPGFELPFGPPQIPFALPDGIPEDIIQFIRDLIARIPGGPFVPNLEELSKSLSEAISSLLNQLAPYLALYRFIQALLNMILCIIDVFCSANNPVAMLRAIRRLFKRCLPDFLALFPWMALIAMILAILRLLLALIEYIIEQLLALLRDLFANIIALGKSIGFNDSDWQLAIARKIAHLLCMIEQLFAIFVAFQAIMAVIQALADLVGRGVCSKPNNDPCCGDDFCPQFIYDNTDGFGASTGTFKYQKKLFSDATAFPGLNMVAREERWQLYDVEYPDYMFVDVISPNSFWPEGKSYDLESDIRKVTYLADVRVQLNPADYPAMASDTDGQRYFRIKNCIVTRKPSRKYKEYDNTTSTIDNGVIMLEGGLVYEDDGTTAYNIGSEQATLNTFLHKPNGTSGIDPNSDDTITFSDVEWLFKPQIEALVGESLITIGCDPRMQIEAGIINNTMDISSVASKVTLPDIGGAVECLESAVNAIRQDVSEATIAEQQANMEVCLEDLKNATLEAYKQALFGGVSPYTSDFALDPELQFISNPILVTVILKDPGGTVVSADMPADIREEVAARITANTSLGTVGVFNYDADTEGFIGELRSSLPGAGTMTIEFDGNTLSRIMNRDEDDVPTEIIPLVKAYEFVGAPVAAAEDDLMTRRDAGDAARDGT